MKRGLPQLKAQYNRVRTSNALQANPMWTDTIGLEGTGGSNAAVEASLSAPSTGGGSARKASRLELAQGLIEASGHEQSVRSQEQLLALARSRGHVSSETRGACKVCGGLGHLTKQCRNVLSGHAGSIHELDAQAAVASVRALLPDPGDLSSLESEELRSSSSGSSSSSDSDGSSSSQHRGEARSDKKRRRRREHRHRHSSPSGEDKRRKAHHRKEAERKKRKRKREERRERKARKRSRREEHKQRRRSRQEDPEAKLHALRIRAV